MPRPPDPGRRAGSRYLLGRFSGRDGLLAMLLHQLGHAVRRLCTLTDPVVDPLQVQLQAALLAGRDRIEIAHLLQGRSALADAAVRDDDVIEGLLLRPAAGEPDRDHWCKSLGINLFNSEGREALPVKGRECY